MNFIGLSLLFLPPSLCLGLFVYIFFRERMAHERSSRRVYSRKGVLKITGLNFFLNLLAGLYFLTFLRVIVSQVRNFGLPETLFLFFYLFMNFVTFYGNGIYITSIVLEKYTLPEIKHLYEFKTQFIATHLFHGPISHILIYSGWYLTFFSLALIDLHLGIFQLNVPPQALIIAGGITGLFYAFAQIYNGTAPYQFITGLVSMIVFDLAIILGNFNFLDFPVAAFFFGIGCLFNLTLFIYVLIDKLNDGKIMFDRSGY